ncbi:MAG: hypothetical protein HIU82_18510 [Proteobacteria bacterium]|nr:hypothetical protein [Pseudomonadota bacterium]
MSLDEARVLLRGLTNDQRESVLKILRQDYHIPIHEIETAWNTTAEAILEAIFEAPDLTQRGVRGVLAEATFRTVVVPQKLAGWHSIPFKGDLPYDLLLDDDSGPLKVQVKNQRREKGAHKVSTKLTQLSGSPVHVVETQRTRNGRSRHAGEEATATRPYRFGDFDILAVCLQPSSRDWADFIYCPCHRLVARPNAPQLLKVLQPIFTNETRGWTRNFDAAAQDTRIDLAAKSDAGAQ